ncbi:MAG: START-like domain-containing protein [Flavobacteriales bacterium]
MQDKTKDNTLFSNLMKEKFQIELLLKTSPKILDSKLTTVEGLSEWFADDVNIRNGQYFFMWDGYEEEAVLLSHKANHHIRFQWQTDIDEELDTYFELAYSLDPMTQAIMLTITDFVEAEDKDSSILMWEQQLQKLRRLIGA